jgi:hypothetical protein
MWPGGSAGATDLSGVPVALASRCSDDEPGSSWTYLLYLGAGASGEQRAVLEDIFTGRLGGDALGHFPWAWKETVRIRDRHDGGATVTCVIPGHERSGEELVADGRLAFEYHGVCGYGSTFDYAG